MRHLSNRPLNILSTVFYWPYADKTLFYFIRFPLVQVAMYKNLGIMHLFDSALLTENFFTGVGERVCEDNKT